MVKLATVVNCPRTETEFGLGSSIMLLGSCFASAMADKFAESGFNTVCNPFGTLYNPASIASAIKKLDSDDLFCESDCVQMGAGDGRICSFSHHSSFARESAGEFLKNANARLQQAREFWKNCDRVIITLGTAMVWKHGGKVVSNCLKRPAKEFSHEMLELQQIRELLRGIVEKHPEKSFLFTVSPIRHLAQYARDNTVSKSALHLALYQEKLPYFPAFEILMDQLRDYRFYAEDLVHPSKVAVDIIWEAFLNCAVPQKDRAAIEQNVKLSKAASHERRS